MKSWKMLTLVGKDQPGIVAQVSNSLYEIGAQLGEASMMGLGGNFTIMLMVNADQDAKNLSNTLAPILKPLDLTCHIQEIDAELFINEMPDTRITVYGSDHAGIVAKVTKVLADSGFNILDLESDMAGNIEKPIYIMKIEGTSKISLDEIKQSLINLEENVEIEVSHIDTLLG